MSEKPKTVRPDMNSLLTVEAFVSGNWKITTETLRGLIKARPASKYTRTAGIPTNGTIIGLLNKFIRCLRQPVADGSRLPVSVRHLSGRTLGSLTAAERSALVRAAHQSGKGKVVNGGRKHGIGWKTKYVVSLMLENTSSFDPPKPAAPAKTTEQRVAELEKIRDDANAELRKLRPVGVESRIDSYKYSIASHKGALAAFRRRAEVLSSLLMAVSAGMSNAEAYAAMARNLNVDASVVEHIMATWPCELFMSDKEVAEREAAMAEDEAALAELQKQQQPAAPPQPEPAK